MTIKVKEKNEISESGELLPAEILEEIQQALQKCYVCRRCISGCPVANQMEYPPAVMLKMLALGQVEKVLQSRSIWLCTSCQNCYSRCPFEINIPYIIDLLKEYATKKGLGQSEKAIRKFHKVFLNEIKRAGRVHEMSFIAKWKMATGNLFGDMLLGMKMFLKGKLSLLPEKIKDRQSVKEMFKP